MAVTYYVEVFHGFRTLVVLIALAVPLGGWLPEPHAHFDRVVTIVHAHTLADLATHHDDGDGKDAAAHATFGHGDHSTALSLVQPYQVGGRFVLTTAAVVDERLVVSCSAVARLCKRPRTLLPTHDPPLRFTSSPAPPTIV